MFRAKSALRVRCYSNAKTRRVATEVTGSHLVSKESFLDEGSDDLPPLKFVTGHEGREAERPTRFIWERIVCLLEHGEEREANSLLEEFDEPPLWDDILY